MAEQRPAASGLEFPEEPAGGPDAPDMPAADSAGGQNFSPRRMAVRRFFRNRLAVVSVVVMALISLAAILAPLISPHDPFAVDLAFYRSPPNETYLFGTDSAGRDVLSRILYGGRVSLVVGIVAALTAGTMGLLIGSIAGLVGGIVDAILMRISDILLSFPALLVVLVVVALIGPSIGVIIIAIGLFEWPSAARIVRSVALVVREQEFVQASTVFGGRLVHILVRHIIPAVTPPLTVAGTVLVARAIMLEASLSFLGFGVPPPTPTWGGMLHEAQSLTILQQMPWLWLAPGIAIAVTVMSINFIGDGLRDAQDPRRRLT